MLKPGAMAPPFLAVGDRSHQVEHRNLAAPARARDYPDLPLTLAGADRRHADEWKAVERESTAAEVDEALKVQFLMLDQRLGDQKEKTPAWP